MKLKKLISEIISTGLYIGHIPLAPGTFASAIMAIAIFYIPLNLKVHLAFISIITALGIPLSAIYAKGVGNKDPSSVVIDEFIGMSIALVEIPRGFWAYFVAFLVFRGLDIIKPYPINKSQDFPGGFGIIIDDMIAGGFTLVIMQILLAFSS